MAYLTNSIGANTFVELTGAIFYRQEQLEIFNRPGVVGSGVRRLGARGTPFELTSKQYHADFAAAKTALQTYDDAPGTNPVTLIRNSIDHGTYLVLEVMEVSTVAVMNPSGNANPAHTVLQTVKWKLLG